MMKRGIAKFFWHSIVSGTTYQLIIFGVKLLCGMLLAQLLTYAMGAKQGEIFIQAALTMAILAVSVVPLYLLNRIYQCAKGKDEQAFREWLYQALLGRQLRVRSQGELEVKFRRDTREVVSFYTQVCPDAAGGSVILVGATLLLCWIDWRVGLLLFCLNLIQLLPIFVYEKWTKTIYDETCSAEEDVSAWILEGYNGAHILKSYHAQDWYLERYRTLAKEVMRWGFRAESAGTFETVIFSAIENLLNYGNYVILGLFSLFGGVEMAALPMLIILSEYLFSSMSTIFDLWLQWVESHIALGRLGLKQVWKNDEADHANSGETVLQCLQVSKHFKDKTVLSGISLTVCAGEHILLQGINGSGKSTLLRILLGLEQPDSGFMKCFVSMDDISYALQEEPQTELTIRELSQQLGKDPNIDGATLLHHLTAFSIAEVMDQPLAQCSSGQIKRFFLSVALSKKSKVLILDEPTNHLDQDSVAYLVQTLHGYPNTLIVCTHLDIPDFHWDRKIRLEGGEIDG